MSKRRSKAKKEKKERKKKRKTQGYLSEIISKKSSVGVFGVWQMQPGEATLGTIVRIADALTFFTEDSSTQTWAILSTVDIV